MITGWRGTISKDLWGDQINLLMCWKFIPRLVAVKIPIQSEKWSD